MVLFGFSLYISAGDKTHIYISYCLRVRLASALAAPDRTSPSPNNTPSGPPYLFALFVRVYVILF